MQSPMVSAPFPDLRVIATGQLLLHEHHDPQRSWPLVENLRASETLVNPPIVAPMKRTGEGQIIPSSSADQFVVLDGANRSFAFNELAYPHLLVQVVDYNSPQMTLDVWGHVISDLAVADLLAELQCLPDLAVQEDQRENVEGASAYLLTDGKRYAVVSRGDDIHRRNRNLSEIVAIYGRNAVLNRTTVRRFEDVLPQYPSASGLMIFPPMVPDDILTAAQHQAYLPPGVTRHIVQGRAIQVNFPLAILRDGATSTDAKNEMLRNWVQKKLANRRVRYYAESTYQFGE